MFEPGDIKLVPFPKHLVESIDGIVMKSKEAGITEGRIETEKHWEIANDIFRLWAQSYPDEYRLFRDTQINLKKSQKNKNGSARDKGGAEVQHVMEIPMKFYRLLKGIFPNVDRQMLASNEFPRKFAQRLPLLKIADKV